MSLESSEDSKEKEKKKIKSSKEHKWKELLYELFYEIKSEILGTKIEIDEDEYQENIKSITIPKLVKYIHDSIQILIKRKIEETKTEQKKEDEKKISSMNNNNIKSILNNSDINEYESILKKMESKERYLTKLNFQNKLQKDAMENKISDYMEMEEEFEEMKTKLKYEDGRFLNNDRKDNEIIIIRGENSNLKKTIKNLEQQISDLKKEISEKGKLISELENEKKNMKIKLDEIQKQNDILNSHSINININNVTGTNNKNTIQSNNINKIDNINRHINEKYPNYFNCDINAGYNKDENKNKYFPYKKINSKILNNKKNQREALSNTKNEASDKTKNDYLNKYFTGNRINNNRNNLPLNNSCAKVNYYPIGNNNKINNNNYMPVFNRNLNYNLMKKVVAPGGNNSSRSTSNKVKAKAINHNINEFNYQSLS